MQADRDKDRVSLEGLDPEVALRALMKVDPDAEPVEQDEPAKQQRDEQDEGRKA
jgi:hypothetical protein